MNKWIKYFLIANSLLWGVFVRAQIKVLTWDECVSITKERNPELKAAYENLKAMEQLEKAAYGNFLPTITGNLEYTKSDSRFGGSTLGAGSINRGELYSANIKGQWNLFSGLQDLGRIKQAEANTKTQRATLQTVEAKISYELKTSYQGLAFAKSYLTLTEEIVKRRLENLRLVELRFESGLENKGSVLLSEANYEQAKYDNLQAKNAKRVASVSLARILGLDEFTDFDIEGEVLVKDISVDEVVDFKSSVTSNPEVSIAQGKEEAAKEAITISRANFFPKLNLVGSAGRSEDGFFPDDNRMWSFGLNLSVPLFAGGQNYFSIKSTASMWAVANKTFENTKRSVLARLEQTFAAYKESIVKLNVDKGYREATEVRAEISRKRYNNGLMTFDAWNIIEDDLIQRQKTYLNSRRERVTAEAQYEQVMGLGVFRD